MLFYSRTPGGCFFAYRETAQATLTDQSHISQCSQMLVKRPMELHDEIITKPQNKTYAYAMHNNAQQGSFNVCCFSHLHYTD
jgi:hypothetical protein